jgi:hypothetical protein
LFVHIGDPSSNQATTLESQMIHMIQELFGQTVTIAWEIKNVRSNGLLLTNPGPIEFSLRALSRPDKGAADYALANRV